MKNTMKILIAVLFSMMILSSCATQERFIPGDQWIKIEQSKREFRGFDHMAKEYKKEQKWRARQARKQ